MNTEMTMKRRDFLLLTGGTICMTMLSCNKVTASQGHLPAIQFPETTCGQGGPRAKRILIAYASRCGSTGGVAEVIGQTLCGAAISTDVRLMGNVADLQAYDAVILGSAVRAGQWLPEALDFVGDYRTTLSRMPVAFFVVCMAMKDDTLENRARAAAYLDPLQETAPEVKPVDTGLFPGATDFKKLSFIQTAILKAKGIPEGDFRDWGAIRTWALKLGPALWGS